MTLVGRDSDMMSAQNTHQNKYSSQGYQWVRYVRVVTQGIIKGLQDPIKTDKISKGGEREAANQNEYSKKPKVDLQTCTL